MEGIKDGEHKKLTAPTSEGTTWGRWVHQPNDRGDPRSWVGLRPMNHSKELYNTFIL